MSATNLSLILTESPSARTEKMASYTNESATTALNKAKALMMAMWQGTGAATTQQMADYYEVHIEAVQSCIKDNRDELESDGLRKLNAKEVKALRSQGMSFKDIPEKTTVLTIWTPRAALRLGMLPRDSEVAKQVRTVLLDAAMQVPAEIAIPKTRAEALRLAADLEDKLEAEKRVNLQLKQDKQQLQLQAAKDAPKIDDYDRLLNTDKWMCAREIHKCIGLPNFKQKDLNAFLRDSQVKILSKDTNQPYATWVSKGWAKMQPDRSPSGSPYNIPVFSWNGCIKILEALKKHGRIPVDHQCEFDFGFKVDRGQLAIAGK